MHRHYYFFLLSILVLLASPSKAQVDNDRVTAKFTATPFNKVVDLLESKTSYRFYYDPKGLDTLRFTTESDNQTIHAFLKQLFQGTDFHFAIDALHHVYIVAGREIQEDLPNDFYDRGTQGKEQIAKGYSDYLEIDKLNKAKSSEDKTYSIGIPTAVIGQGQATIAGHIRSAESGEAVIGASVGIESKGIGIATDQFGYYALTLPKGSYELRVKSVGMKSTTRRVILYGNGQLDIELFDDVQPLKEVTIESEKDKNVSGMQMGVEKLDIKTMRKIPVALGEVDIFRVILTLPGVQSVGEATNGLNVRGGATNQNLILFNDATIYNPSHLFGFFSAFNPDVIKNVELYKSGIPATYGGRLSSVLDINSREGNKKKISATGGIGVLTSRLTLEGPIFKDKTSFLIGARTTYSDWLLKQIPNPSISNSDATFYDVNAHISHEINSKNSLYATGYLSKDHFKLNSDTLYTYQNKNATLKWKHIFGNKLYGVLTSAFSGYDYSVSSDNNPVNGFTLAYHIKQLQNKADFSYYPSAKHGFNFGASTINYALSPGSYQPNGRESLVVPNVLQNEQGRESAAYISDHFEVTPRFSLYGGFRYSYYQYLGPKDVYTYAPGLSKTTDTILDTVSYKTGKTIQHYQGPEFRFSTNYILGENSSVKLSYNRMRQYLQMLSNTAAISPTDIWKLSDQYIKPQIGDQLAIGYYRNFRSNTIETSVEAYYKQMQNSIDYKSGAQLILNHHIETDVLNAQGRAYGIEFLVKKMTGKINGWISYTYSRSLLKTKNALPSETVNNGRWYPSNYDKPNAVNFIGNYKFSHRFSTSLNMTYSTGRPITLPVAKYDVDGTVRLFYSDRNQYRIPDYFRVDLAINIEGNHKVRKLAHSSWTVGVYNLTGRRNAYSVFFESSGAVIRGYKLSIFGQPIPTITYNFRF
jgi:CarboxypepD_reg-like domain/TonB-dependent Receptor Plug Domain